MYCGIRRYRSFRKNKKLKRANRQDCGVHGAHCPMHSMHNNITSQRMEVLLVTCFEESFESKVNILAEQDTAFF